MEDINEPVENLSTRDDQTLSQTTPTVQSPTFVMDTQSNGGIEASPKASPVKSSKTTPSLGASPAKYSLGNKSSNSFIYIPEFLDRVSVRRDRGREGRGGEGGMRRGGGREGEKRGRTTHMSFCH